MAFFIPRPVTAHASQPVALDGKALGALKRQVAAAADSPGRQHAEAAVASQFEALFLQSILRTAHDSPLAAGGLFDSPEMRNFQSMQDEQTALTLAGTKGGIGLGREVLAQIEARRAGQGGATTVHADDGRNPRLKSALPLDAPGPVADSIDGLLQVLGMTPARSAAAPAGTPAVSSFVKTMVPAARQAAAASGVPARLILSQAALESGWGAHEPTDAAGNPSHNLFGIKASASWDGAVVHAPTTEYVNGAARRVVQPFRAYDSYGQAFGDYAALISRNPRYQAVVNAPSAVAAAQEIQRAGYATDPGYAAKLVNIMRQIEAVIQGF